MLRVVKMCMATKTDRIIFFGSGQVAHPSLQAITQRYTNVHVVTHHTPDKRKITNEVQLLCQQHNIPYSTPITSHTDKSLRKQQWDKFRTQLHQPILAVVCSYGFMIPSSVIDLFQQGGIVVHPSLLPKYRGGAPIFHAIANGETESGVSYIEISKNKFDQGNILLQVKYQLDPKKYYSQIQKQLSELAAQHIPTVIQTLTQLKPGIPQSTLIDGLDPHLLKAPIIRTKKLQLNQECKKVYNWSRALEIPRVVFQGNEIIVTFEEQWIEGEGEVGTLKKVGKKVYVRCKDKYLRLKSWREISKKELPMYTFIDRFMKKGQIEEPKQYKFQ